MFGEVGFIGQLFGSGMRFCLMSRRISRLTSSEKLIPSLNALILAAVRLAGGSETAQGLLFRPSAIFGLML